MSRFNTGNPLGSDALKDLSDNAKSLDELVNSKEKLSNPDRFGVQRKTWHGIERQMDDQQTQFTADQGWRDSEFNAAQTTRAEQFSFFLSVSGYQPLGEYTPGIEITAHNQYVEYAGQPYLLKPSVPVPYTTSGEWDGEDFKLIGDNALRQDLANPDKGAAMVAFKQESGSALPISVSDKLQSLPVTVEEFGAKGDGVTDDSAAIIAAAAFSDHVLFSRKQYVAQGLPIRTGLIYEGVSGETEIHLPTTPSDHMFKTTGTTDTIESGGLKNLKLDGGGTTDFNGADFSSIFDERLDYWIVEDCWFSGFNRGFNGTNNDREPTFRNCRFIRNEIGAYGGEHPLFIGCDFRSNGIGLSGRLNDLKVSNCKFAYNRIGVAPDRDADRSLTNAIFNACGFFRNSEIALLVGTGVTVSNCHMVGNGAGSVGIHSFTGTELIATGNNFRQVGFDSCIKITREAAGPTHDINIQANNFAVECAAAVQSDVAIGSSTISNNIFGGTVVDPLVCISVPNCTTTVISGNLYRGRGIFYQSLITYNVTFSGNVIDTNSSETFIQLGQGAGGQGNVFTGNAFHKRAAGLAPVFSGSLARAVITSNKFGNNAKIDLDLITSTAGTIVADNAGLATVTSGSFRFEEGETSRTISFVLDWPVKTYDVALTPTTNSASQAQVHVTNVDNGTGTVTFTSQAPMGDNALFVFKIVTGDA